MRSEVAIYDLETRTATAILQSNELVEAPNWTRDGKALIVNSNGRLFRIDLAHPEMIEIDSGFANRLNNDHGISPDGSLLAISDSTKDGMSAVYTLPVGGGLPRRVTENVPSYWHGWSPDGATLAYVAKRDGTFQIYTCALEGGEEFQVTRGFDHCDGPDYTPDGKWIWFNGEKEGEVALWRIRPDGSGAEKMTADERVNWFPHPSPDGKHILYVAYEPGVKSHPRDQDVELRLLPAEGGHPEILLSLVGGQGTINVPCWAPDSKTFAFVRFSR
ncbi:TolB family protein [Rhizobium sp. RAF56]|jgi:Tol biopolymer transport system component|uniref:TolB family protein n=1 Tax=Rhizobium sp. RAF56 TaxID=3233062 RepID=UPI003F9E3419